METKFKRGDRVLVRDWTSPKWVERIYLTIIKGSTFPYLCVELSHENAFNNGDEFRVQNWKHIKPLENEVKCWEDLGCGHPEWVTLEQQLANTAMMKLSQLMKDVNGDWIPNWNNGICKYIIVFYKGEIEISQAYNRKCFLSFPTKEIRDKFLENHRELIMKAKPLL